MPLEFRFQPQADDDTRTGQVEVYLKLLDSKFTYEMLQDLRAIQGLDAEAEFVNILTEEARLKLYAIVLNDLSQFIYQRNIEAGWYNDLKTGEDLRGGGRNRGELMMLIVTEIAEAFEGYRKNLPDDKLPQHPMPKVEFADAIIRILDTAADMGYEDIGNALVEKMEFNRNRPDHKKENRLKENGKKF